MDQKLFSRTDYPRFRTGELDRGGDPRDEAAAT